MRPENHSETVRISSGIKRRVEAMAKKVRPRSTIQYVIEAAIEEYLQHHENAVHESRPEYQVKKGMK